MKIVIVNDKLSVKAGDRLRHENGGEYIVARIDSANFRLINLLDGNRWSEKSLFNGTENEFELIRS